METIIFDVDDTLYDQALSFHKTFEQLMDGKFTYKDIAQIYRRSREYSEILFDQSETGKISTFEWQTGRIIKACHDFNIEIDEEKASVFHQVYKKEQGKIELFPEIKQLLDGLYAKGCQLAILTNGEENHQLMKIKQLQLDKWIPEQRIIISGSHGYAKPKQEIFDIVEQRLKCDPSKTIYIGDSYEKDIVGAKQAGWQAIWMNHRNKSLSAHHTVFPDKEVYS